MRIKAASGQEQIFNIEEHLLQLKGEDVIFIRGRAFVVSPATESDIKRVSTGYVCMD